MSKSRSYEIRLPESFPPSIVRVNGIEYEYSEVKAIQGWSYDGQELTASISIPEQSKSEKLEIQIVYNKEYLTKRDLIFGKKGAFKRLQQIIGLMKIEIARENWWALLTDKVFDAEQVPVKISYDPNSIVGQLELFEENYQAILEDMRNHADARKEVTDKILVPLEKY